jgi:hypothetical protein
MRGSWQLGCLRRLQRASKMTADGVRCSACQAGDLTPKSNLGVRLKFLSDHSSKYRFERSLVALDVSSQRAIDGRLIVPTTSLRYAILEPLNNVVIQANRDSSLPPRNRNYWSADAIRRIVFIFHASPSCAGGCSPIAPAKSLGSCSRMPTRSPLHHPHQSCSTGGVGSS